MAITLVSDEYDEIRLLTGGRHRRGGPVGRTDQWRHGARGGRIVCAAAYSKRSEWVEHCGSTCLSPGDTVSVRVDFGAVFP